jgi:hypothetical protein
MTFMMESVLDDTPLHVYTAFQLVKLMILKPLSHRQRSLGSGLWVMVLAHSDTLAAEMRGLSDVQKRLSHWQRGLGSGL